MSLGEHLLAMRERVHFSRSYSSILGEITAEHLRNVEADKSRPSPEVLRKLLNAYDIDPDERVKAWVLLARSYLPTEVLDHVDVHPRTPSKDTP